MSRADYIYLKTTNSILKDGSWEDGNVRPHWEDGTPAYTIKKFSVNNVYRVSEEFPIVSLRNTNWRAAIDEIIWIWAKKSNNINELNSQIWNQWADESGSIGEAYGAQVGKVSKYREGEFDQMDRILYQLKNSIDVRRIIAELYIPQDLHKMHLYPCVHGLNFVVTEKNKLNLLLNQRSNDTLAAGSWNVVQYASLLCMVAQVCDMEVGDLSHIIADSHIYDRHIPFVVDLTLSRAKEIQKRIKDTHLCEIISQFQSPQVREKFEKFQDELQSEKTTFDKLIVDAREYEKLSQNSPKSLSAESMRKYTKKILDSDEFHLADKITNTMFENNDFEKFLSFSSPKLTLNKNVKNFYDFKSPKMRDEKRKIINNPDSSFDIKNYSPEKEGIKFEAKVPVAE